MLSQTFYQLLAAYTNQSHAEQLWQEIESAYTQKKPYYHNLAHLTNLWEQLNALKHEISNWDTMLFTLFYHDVIYNPLKSDNEVKSAAFAVQRMQQLDMPTEMISACNHQILATQTHQLSTDTDTNYFIDADLSILGTPWETYTQYFQNVRKEYAIYPDLIYHPGRKKVLKHFLAMQRIFKTDYFNTQFEAAAKRNLQQELMML